jgi:hypothetical protein
MHGAAAAAAAAAGVAQLGCATCKSFCNSNRVNKHINSTAAAAAAAAAHPAAAAAAAGGGATGAFDTRQRSRLQQQQGWRNSAVDTTAVGGSPLSSAVAVIMGPMHAAAFCPSVAQQATTTPGSYQNSNDSGWCDSVIGRAGTNMTAHQTDQQAVMAMAVGDIYAQLPPVPRLLKQSMGRQTTGWPQQQQQQQSQPSRLFSSDADRQGVSAERQQYLLTTGSITRKTAGHAAMTSAGTAKPAQQHTAAAAAGRSVSAAAELELRYHAVCAPMAAAADRAPTSCLSPLHWHQSNLGRGRAEFFQAMVSANTSAAVHSLGYVT